MATSAEPYDRALDALMRLLETRRAAAAAAAERARTDLRAAAEGHRAASAAAIAAELARAEGAADALAGILALAPNVDRARLHTITTGLAARAGGASATVAERRRNGEAGHNLIALARRLVEHAAADGRARDALQQTAAAVVAAQDAMEATAGPTAAGQRARGRRDDAMTAFLQALAIPYRRHVPDDV